MGTQDTQTASSPEVERWIVWNIPCTAILCHERRFEWATEEEATTAANATGGFAYRLNDEEARTLCIDICPSPSEHYAH